MKLLKGYLALILALLITLSAAGVNVSVHWCCGKIKNFTVFGDTKVCSMGMGHELSAAVANSSGGSVDRLPCCNNQTINLHQEVQAAFEKNRSPVNQTQPVLFTAVFLPNFLLTPCQLSPESGTLPLVCCTKEPLSVLFRQFRI